MSHPHLRIVRLSAEEAVSAAVPTPADVGLLAFLLALHAAPVVALVAGRAWGGGVVGYATAVALFTARELFRELGACAGASSRRHSR
jgi:hypothetical protein